MEPIEFDCLGCRQHIIDVSGTSEGKYCAMCITIPGWYCNPELVRIQHYEGPTVEDRLRAFAQDIFGEWPDGGGCDGFELQELAEKHGLLQPVRVAEPCGEECWCASEAGRDEFPMVCFRKTPVLTGKQL